MVQGFLAVLLFQLIGELIVVGLAVPLPGPVLGMVLLAAGLLMIGRVPASLRAVSQGLLSNLALLFVPAGVGLVLHFELLRSEWWIILLALVGSSLIAAAVTAWTFSMLVRRRGGGRAGGN